MNRMAIEPLQKIAGQNYDPRYQQNAADDFRQFGLPPGGRVFPTPEFTPDYAYRDSVFVMPPNPAAHDLGFDAMDLADRPYYRERTFGPPQTPKIRRF